MEAIQEVQNAVMPIESEGNTSTGVAKILVCQQCGLKQPLPQHCGRDMLLDPQTKDKLVCWMNIDMGIQCGESPIPQHHGKPMKIVDLK
jgi:hypothetical protein